MRRRDDDQNPVEYMIDFVLPNSKLLSVQVKAESCGILYEQEKQTRIWLIDSNYRKACKFWRNPASGNSYML